MREPVPHVPQGLLVHRLVLEDGIGRQASGEDGIVGAENIFPLESLENEPIGPIGVVEDLLA
ncbi:MAG TPA: hypothetical protein VER78_06435, partial [Thermoanaerobaculia bacterium]|nr:hypothetical protein [Thermoanaerobaculia bacterium]